MQVQGMQQGPFPYRRICACFFPTLAFSRSRCAVSVSTRRPAPSARHDSTPSSRALRKSPPPQRQVDVSWPGHKKSQAQRSMPQPRETSRAPQQRRHPRTHLRCDANPFVPWLMPLLTASSGASSLPPLLHAFSLNFILEVQSASPSSSLRGYARYHADRFVRPARSLARPMRW